MRALVYTAARRLEVQHLPSPQPGDGELLVRIHAAGVCGSDLDGFLGKSKRRVPPLILGHEFSGEIAMCGTSSPDFRVGDRVAVYPLVTCGECKYCRAGRHNICPNRKVYGLDFHGGLAEYVSARPECLFRMPESMSFVEGALVEPLANAIHVLTRLPSVQNQVGIVYGAGPIGALVCWAAKYFGCPRLAVVDVNAKRLARVRDMGADAVFQGLEQNLVNSVLDWTAGQRLDFAVDAVGQASCRKKIISMMAPGGTAVWIGMGEDMCEISGHAIVTQELEVKGSYAYGLKDFAQALAVLSQGVFPVKEFVSEMHLENGQKAFEDLVSGQSGLMKVVFQI